MADLPAPVSEFIDALTEDLLAPAYLLVTNEGGLTEWGGALESYGITGLEKDVQVGDHLAFLVGLLPLDSGGTFLPNVQTTTDVFADVYIFRSEQGTWILFLDATVDVKKRQALQQRTYEISLQAAQLEQEGRSLYDANSVLEQRVREQTAELSQTVLRLQQELADGRRTERALSISESRFRSLFDCNVVGIVFWDATGKITEANDAFLRLLGYSREDLARGDVKWDRISLPFTQVVDELSFADTLDPLTCELHEREFIRKDGSTKILHFGGSVAEGTAKSQVGFVVNFSERKNSYAAPGGLSRAD
jgi:PAS domain S-box-containing protein